ncbi:MAG TPA: EAL domain-containing protein [Terracidiphilus sp.]|jgi:sensor c-di-GMP phosphodiesterase-like protein|nr:EAL domain-containing protein [Terracidiphilus sp.]
MRTFRQRVWVSALVITCGFAVGGFAGYWLGRVLTLKQSEGRLEQYATRIINEGEHATAESRKVLTAMNASHLAMCSDAEIDSFSNLIYESQYLKAAGRMHNGQIQCTTSLGRAAQSTVKYEPDILERDGTRLYRNLAPFHVGKELVITVQQGDSFVVYSPYNLKPLLNSSMQLTITDVDAPNYPGDRFGAVSAQAPRSVLAQNGKYADQNLVYGTHCSPDGVMCVSAHMAIAQAMTNNRLQLGGFTVLGELTGTLLGLLCAIAYRRQHDFANQLLRAIRQDALRIVYQPIVDLESEQIVEGEALARWTTEDNEAISPDDFIKVAEQKGFVGQITKLVVRHVLADFGKTLRERPGFRVNVNVAASDLADPEFLPMLEKALADAKVSASSLGIEITESFTARQQIAKETILRLREKGHYVHIDDFGTGYSSLAYLHDLSVDAIKIDKAFTKAIGTDAVTVTILPQILTMADTLGLRVVVEGIETPQQAKYFANADQSIYAQGWLFGRPVPPEAFHRLLEGKEAKPELVGSIESRVVSPVPAA